METSNKPDHFSFVCLPLELRKRIYGLLFDLPGKGARHTVFPTSLPSVLKRKKTYFGSGLGLLRVCGSVHAEVTAMLYSHTSFGFSDDPSDSFNPTKHSRISHCGITSMYSFLQIIGPRNRGLIRYLSIKVSNPRYLYYNHEAVPGYEHDDNGGKELGDALALLSLRHSLQVISFHLKEHHGSRAIVAPKLLARILRPIEDSKLLHQLIKIRGNVKLRICGSGSAELEMPEEFELSFTTLKSLLAQPREIKEIPKELLQIEDRMEDTGPQVLGVTKQYLNLLRQIEAEEKKIVEWEVLQRQIEAAKGRIKSLVTKKQAIEEGLQEIQKRAAELTALFN
ncbi:hypothetical protein MMC11_001068 [Xylographa trunciseda]|nr:hypothetical protein [Xylographa trunciseda]